MKGREGRLLTGLAETLGLDADGSKPSQFAVLKAAAEALGCRVEDDGTVYLVNAEESSEEEEAREEDIKAADEQRKRKRRKEEGSEDSDEEEEEAEDEDEGAGIEYGEESSEESSSDDDMDDDEDNDDDPLNGLFTDPLSINDDGPEGVYIEGLERYESIEDPEGLMQWLIAPMDLECFLEEIHERQPLLISRSTRRDYHSGLLSRADIEAMLERKEGGGLQYSYEVDVTHYSRKGVRENFNYNSETEPSNAEKKEGMSSPPEIADPKVVWKRVDKDGCSLRLLHPQRYVDPLWRLLSKLEDFWRSPLGANSYLTPAGAQGFAPHFDDIDAFILQLEGSKKWRLHAPTEPRNILPRYSSRDFVKEELGEVVLEVVLQPGDLLYMPRGQVHQAESVGDSHSLHLTISANQQRTWEGLFERLLPRALQLAAAQYPQLRASVPRELSLALGTALLPLEDEAAEKDRALAKERVLEYANVCFQAVADSVDFDWGADQWDQEFLLHRLPPPPRKPPHEENGKASGSRPAKMKYNSVVKVVHPGAARLMIDADGEMLFALVAHCMANKRCQHAAKDEDECEIAEGEKKKDDVPPVVEFPVGCDETLAALLAAEEEGVCVGEVPEPDKETGVGAVDVADALRKAGLIEIVGSAK